MQGISKEILEKQYPFTNVTIGRTLQKSGQRVVCEVSADEGNFVFKVLAPYKAEERIKGDTFALEFLAGIAFSHIPKLLKTRHGESYATAHNVFFYVMERVEGKEPERTAKTYEKLAEIAASLHDIAGYPKESFFKIGPELAKLQETAKKFPFEKEFKEIASMLPDFEELPRSFIHSDIGTHNAVEKEDGTIILTDWDDAGLGITILDLGFPLICSFIDHELAFHEELAKAFYQTYFSKRNLSKKEKSLIFDAGLFFALIYTEYGEVEKNWQRIIFAVKNKEIISRVLA